MESATRVRMNMCQSGSQGSRSASAAANYGMVRETSSTRTVLRARMTFGRVTAARLPEYNTSHDAPENRDGTKAFL